MNKDDINKRINEIELEMTATDFWSDKDRAQSLIKEMNELKDQSEGKDKYDKGNAVLTVFAGAGGDDAEDFARMLVEMYLKFIEKQNWQVALLHKNENDHGGYRNITFEICGKDVYGSLRYESGVHRLVRLSPFNAKKQRHTAFAMVEVTPAIDDLKDFVVPEEEIRVEFSKSGGPGGQNVNKRETAVRVVHIPSEIAVHVDSERSQAQNREKALKLLYGKLYKAMEEQKKKEEEGLHVSKSTQIEWGSQIRSYVLHPYKMVKDHRTEVEIAHPDKVLDGDIEPFLEAEKAMAQEGKL